MIWQTQSSANCILSSRKSYTHWTRISTKLHVVSLVPRPRPAFRRLQYGKAGRAWYLSSREHDVISKLWKFAELAGCVSRIFNRYTFNAQCVRQSPPASQIRVVSYLVPWLFSLFWAQCAHAQSNHPFYPDVSHSREQRYQTRPSPALPYWKLGGAWEGSYMLVYSSKPYKCLLAFSQNVGNLSFFPSSSW